MLGNKGEAIKKRKDELLGIKKQDGNALFEEICEYKEITVQHGQDKFRLVLFHYPLSEWNAGATTALSISTATSTQISQI